MRKDNDVFRENIIFPHKDLKISVTPNKISNLDNPDRAFTVFHEEIEIKYFYEGSSTLMVDSDMLVTSPGDIVVINPYEFHSTIDFDEHKGEYHLFIVGLDFFMEDNRGGLDLRKLLIGKKIRFNHLIQNNERLRQILIHIVEEYGKKDEYHALIIRGLLLEFFSLLLRGEVSPLKSDIVQDERIRYYGMVEPAVQKIRNSYNQKMSVDDLAELCNVSKCHFCRIFKLAMNMTVVEYITEYRFKIADYMLTYTDKSIAEIARDCGFEDESYFCRCYKKKRGISPYKNKAILYQK